MVLVRDSKVRHVDADHSWIGHNGFHPTEGGTGSRAPTHAEYASVPKRRSEASEYPRAQSQHDGSPLNSTRASADHDLGDNAQSVADAAPAFWDYPSMTMSQQLRGTGAWTTEDEHPDQIWPLVDVADHATEQTEYQPRDPSKLPMLGQFDFAQRDSSNSRPSSHQAPSVFSCKPGGSHKHSGEARPDTPLSSQKSSRNGQ